MSAARSFLVFSIGVLSSAVGCGDGGEASDAGGVPSDGNTDSAVTADGSTPDSSEAPPCGTERVREDLAIPTIDGYELSAFLDRPAQEDCPLPTILLQTPYDKESAWNSFFQEERPERPLFDSPFYNYVVVDWRGSHGSKDLPHPGDGPWMAQDSYDTVEWIASQSWSNGKVGTWGVSALCGAQYRTASGPINNTAHPDFDDEPPPHLSAMVPIMCAMRTTYEQAYPGGVLRHDWASTLDVLGFGVRTLYENNPRQNWLWDIVEGGIPSDRMRVPALVVSGWWDLLPSHTVAAYEELRASSDPSVRDEHRLLIGPWIHFATGGSDVGSGAARPLTDEELAYLDLDRVIDADSLAFFDYHMRGIQNQAASWAPVRYFHENLGWQSADEWPPAASTTSTLYLDDENGLVDTAPASGSLSIPYDPSDPSPSIGCATLGPYNCVADPNPILCMLTPSEDKLLLHGPLSQQALFERSDQITFATAALAEPIALLGEVRLYADIAVSGADADLAVRILDIDDSGDPRLIGEGIQRLSARDGLRAYSQVTPDQRYSVAVEIQKDFAYTIPVGHRLGVMLSGSHWPLYARNPGDGAVFMGSDTTDQTNETFSYGAPATVVDLKGTGQPVTLTVHLDGATRLEIGTAE